MSLIEKLPDLNAVKGGFASDEQIGISGIGERLAAY